MKKSAKLLSVILAVIMALSVLPMVAFAEEAAAEDTVADKVAAWKENYTLLFEELYDNEKYVSYEYVDTNMNAIDKQMTAYTALALYDDAWRNYATHDIEKEEAEKILLSLIERAEYTFDDGYADEVIAALKGIEEAGDFVEAASKYIDALDFVETDAWGTAFEILSDVNKIATAYQDNRDKFVEEYARVLSVQKANAYYIDMLGYIAENSENEDLAAAAEKLIADINTSVEDVIEEILADFADDEAMIGVDILVDLAMDSNVYTAVAKKVYDGAVGVADFFLATNATAPKIIALKTAYYFQALVADWAEEAIEGENADKAYIAADFLLTTRSVSEQALYNLKLAENGGLANKIKNQLYGTVYNDIEVNLAAIDAMRNILFETDVADMKAVVSMIRAYCPVDVQIVSDNIIVYTLADGNTGVTSNDYGVFAGVDSDYADTCHKVVFLYDTYTVRLVGTKDGYVTVIMDILKDGAVEDWSFTDRLVAAGTRITFDTAFEGTPVYTASDCSNATEFNDTFVASAQPEVTAKEVAEATVTVAKKEAKSFADIIKEFFQKLIEAIFGAFKK